jgi:lipopolysaccharide/colanic/teichoic acid biosynthesis glycosyltransferase
MGELQKVRLDQIEEVVGRDVIRAAPNGGLPSDARRGAGDFISSGNVSAGVLSFAVQPPSRSGMFDHERTINIILASILLVVFAPVFAVVATLIWLEDRGPLIFRHRRIGRNGRLFNCLKFRSMAAHAEMRLARLLKDDPVARAEWDRDHKLRNDPRITKIGRFLRASSLDEIPQLINVIRGDMSLVGPRPIVQDEVVRYGRRIESYLKVRPGITGLWQVSGRNDVSYRRRVAMDVLYARRKSFSRDLVILFCTIPAVLLRKGSY